MAFIEVDSKNIYYDEYGADNERVIAYFHGGPGEGCWSFVHQAMIFGEKYRVITFDQYGVLRSDAIGEDEAFGVMEHVQLIDKMRIALGIEKWAILGHSYGGMLACLYAYTFVHSVDAVIYDCPTWNMSLTSKAVARHLMPYYQQINAIDALKICGDILDENTTAREVFKHFLALPRNEQTSRYMHAIDAAEYEQYIRKYIPNIEIGNDDQQKFIRHTQKLIDSSDFYGDYLPCLKDINTPSLLIVGEYDLTCDMVQRDYFREYSVYGVYVELKKCAHLLWMQESKAYTKAILDFLKGLELG